MRAAADPPMSEPGDGIAVLKPGAPLGKRGTGASSRRFSLVSYNVLLPNSQDGWWGVWPPLAPARLPAGPRAALPAVAPCRHFASWRLMAIPLTYRMECILYSFRQFVS